MNLIKMQTLFNICFGIGVALAALNLLSTILGLSHFLHTHFDFDFDFDFDFCGLDFGAFLPLTPTLMIIFLTVFGGVGKILFGFASPLISVLAAFGSGFAIVFIINKLVVMPLRKMAAKETIDNDGIIGMTGFVSEKILNNDFGQVTFIHDGNTISGPAKNMKGGELPVNTQVVILDIVNNVYMVEEISG